MCPRRGAVSKEVAHREQPPHRVRRVGNVGALAALGGGEQPLDGRVEVSAPCIHRAEHVEHHIRGVLQGDEPPTVLEHNHARKLAVVIRAAAASPANLFVCGQRVAREKHFRLGHRGLPQARLVGTARRAFERGV